MLKSISGKTLNEPDFLKEAAAQQEKVSFISQEHSQSERSAAAYQVQFETLCFSHVHF